MHQPFKSNNKISPAIDALIIRKIQGSTGMMKPLVKYPLVNIQKAMERSTMLLMGKSTISMAIFNCYVSSPEGICPLVSQHAEWRHVASAGVFPSNRQNLEWISRQKNANITTLALTLRT